MSTSSRIAGSSVVMRHSPSVAIAPVRVAPPQTLPSSDVTTSECAVHVDTTAMGGAGGAGGVEAVGIGVESPAQLVTRRRQNAAPRLRCITQPTVLEAWV